MPKKNDNKHKHNNRDMPIQNIMLSIPRGAGGGGGGDVTMQMVNAAIATHNFASTSHSGTIANAVSGHNTATTAHQYILDKISLRDVLDISIDSTGTELTILYADNHTEVINLASVNLHVGFDPDTQELIIYDENDIEISRVDLSALVPSFTGYNGTHIATSVDNNQISATLNSESITLNELSPTIQEDISSIQGKADKSDLRNFEQNPIVLEEVSLGIQDSLGKADSALQVETDPVYMADKENIALKSELPHPAPFSILVTDWVASTTHSGYGFEAKIIVDGAKTGDMFLGEIDFGDYQTSVESGITRVPGYVIEGGAMIYATSVPTSDLHGTYVLIKGGE